MKQNVKFSKFLVEIPFLDRINDFPSLNSDSILILLVVGFGLSSLLECHFTIVPGTDLGLQLVFSRIWQFD